MRCISESIAIVRYSPDTRELCSWGLVSFVGLARQLSVPHVATVAREVLYDTMYYDPRYQDPTGYAGGPAQMQRGPQRSAVTNIVTASRRP